MSRSSRVTADITLEAHNILREYCVKHERSKGYLLEKMIRRYCAEIEVNQPVVKVPKPNTQIATVKETVKKSIRFIPPTFAEVDLYMIERGVSDQSEAASFGDFYESNGWKVGKNKMKCWKASVRNWLKGYKEKSGGKDILALSAASDWHKEEDQGF